VPSAAAAQRNLARKLIAAHLTHGEMTPGSEIGLRIDQKLREKGESKEKSARIANAAAGSSRSKVGKKGGKNPSYDDWSKADLVKRAREIGIRGRSSMSKSEPVSALRQY
jgi:hypothetical protein